MIFHPVVQRADDQHRDGGGHHLEPQVPDAGLGDDPALLQAKGPQLAPEQHHHGHDGTQLDDHAEHGHELLAGVELDHLLQQNHMAGGRNGQPFGDALHDAHQDRFDDLKKRKYPSHRAVRVITCFSQYTILCGGSHAECENFAAESFLPRRL